MIEILVAILVLLVIVYAVHILVDALKLPDNVRVLFYLILGVIVLLIILNKFQLLNWKGF